jgi:hypothetical protein
MHHIITSYITQVVYNNYSFLRNVLNDIQVFILKQKT